MLAFFAEPVVPFHSTLNQLLRNGNAGNDALADAAMRHDSDVVPSVAPPVRTMVVSADSKPCRSRREIPQLFPALSHASASAMKLQYVGSPAINVHDAGILQS